MFNFLLLQLTYIKDFYADEMKKVEVAPEQQEHIKLFLPEMFRSCFEVDRKIFDVALNSWYHFKNVPLVHSEKESICRKFKNPIVSYYYYYVFICIGF